MLSDDRLLAECGNSVSQGNYPPGLFHVEIFDQSPLDQNDPTACSHSLRMRCNDRVRPGYISGGRGEDRIGRSNGLGMNERLAIKTEFRRLVAHRGKPSVIV